MAQCFVLSGLYGLPFAGPGVVGHIVRGWALSCISTMQTGQPITLTLNFDNANTGTTKPAESPGVGKPAGQSMNRWIDPAAFSFPLPFTYGNAGRNILTGPGFRSTDLSQQRNFGLKLTERSSIEFRAAAFNVFNTPQFGNPNATLGNTAFGTMGGTARSNRQLQLGMRFLF